MKQTKGLKLVTCLLLLILMGVVTGCEKDAYNPDNGKLPPKEDYFDFNLKGDVALSVNYVSQNLKILFEVYTEYPLNESGYSKKEGIKPIYAAFTDKSGKFDGKMNIPTALKTVYLYTEYYGFPKCVKAEITNASVSYALNTATATTRAASGYEWGQVDTYPYALTKFVFRQDNAFALYKWGTWGTLSSSDQIYNTPKVGDSDETMDQFTSRIQNYINKLSVAERRSKLLANRETTDVDIKESGTTLDVVFMGDAAQYANVFGYYYYTEKEYNSGSVDFSLKTKAKYVVFPNASYRDSKDGTQGDNAVLEKGTTVKLQYFGPTGTDSPSYEFPKGYKVGWFFGRNSFVRPGGSTGTIPENGIRDLLNVSGYSSIDAYADGGDKPGTNLSKQRFISLKDTKTGILVLGFEDLENLAVNPELADSGQEDYMDVLFYVKSNKDITGGKPEIPTEPDEPEAGDFSNSGTVAFEDIWPEGGDYDLNDVIVEYERKISFDGNNKVTTVVDTFKPVQPKGSALQNNFFACQYKTPGTLTLPSGMISESATSSVVISESALNISGNTYVVERDLTGKGLTQDGVIADFNPYIITKEYTTTNRVEVHLPLKDMTSAANSELMTKDNAYYVGEDGKYPFAIDIPITGFKPATEKIRIDEAGEYPNFKSWTESKGSTNKDWYNTGRK